IHRDIGLTQAGAPRQFVQDGAEVGVALGRDQAEILHRRAEPPQMMIEAKERAVPHTDHVIGDVRPAVAPLCDRRRGLTDRYIAPADISRARRPFRVHPLLLLSLAAAATAFPIASARRD